MKSGIVHDQTEPNSLEDGRTPEPPRGDAIEVEPANQSRTSRGRGRRLNMAHGPKKRKTTLLVALLAAMTASTPLWSVGSAAAVPQAVAAATPANFNDVIKGIPGLTHYYPLDAANQARDVVGTVNGVNHGATFGTNGATFDGKSYIELPDHNDFSGVTTGAMTVVVFNTITNWKGAGASEYVHWMGKGVGGAHEWTFRHYVAGGSGEAASRQNRTSFYHFNPGGGLGAGSYFQDPDGASERLVAGMVDSSNTQMWKNGVLRDTDALSGYGIKLQNTSTPVRLGTRDMSTGFLIGRLRRVAFFNRKLTAAELKTLYAAQAMADGPGGTTPAPGPAPTPAPGPAPTPGPTTPAPPTTPVTPFTPVTASKVSADGHVMIGATRNDVAGVNIERAADSLVLYTPARGINTRTNQYCAEATVVGGKVTKLVNRTTSGAPAATIPVNGFVLSGHGTARDWLVANAKVGSILKPHPTSSQVVIGTATQKLAGTNVARAANDLVLYTPAQGANTNTNQFGAEATVVGGKVTAFVNRTTSGAAATPIPVNGVVLSGHGTARDWLVANAKVGSTVKF